MKKVAIICAEGIGDGLIMLVGAHAFHQFGFQVILHHHILHQLSEWTEPITFKKQPAFSEIDMLNHYDMILLQNDNSPKSKKIMQLVDREKLYIFYPSYEKNKHIALSENDFVCDQKKPIAMNLATFCSQILATKIDSTNLLRAPKKYFFKKESKRVVIHPTSTCNERTWYKKGFISLYHLLKKNQYHPVFVLGPKEKDYLKNERVDYKVFENLSDLAGYLYESSYVIGNESGIVHLASSLGIPNLVISGHKKRIQLWRPGILLGKVLTPPSFIPNIKGFRLREEKWQSFISSRKVFSLFKKHSCERA